LTIDDISTDKYIEEKLCAFEEKLKAVGQLELILSFFTRVERKAFLIFKNSSKIVWEEWVVPVKVLIDSQWTVTVKTEVLGSSAQCLENNWTPLSHTHSALSPTAALLMRN
jgi:hypothetical protein